MAGAEVDLKVKREKGRSSFVIAGLSFLAPFLGTMLVCLFGLHWDWKAAQLAGIALSTTSLAVA